MTTLSSFRRASAAAEYVQVQIPFPGFYDSALSDEVERAVDCECEHLQDEGADFDGRPVTEEALEAARDAVTVDGFMELEIAEKWTQVYADYLFDAANDVCYERGLDDRAFDDLRLKFECYPHSASDRGLWPWGDEVKPEAWIRRADLRRLRKIAAAAPEEFHEDIQRSCDFAGYVRARFTPADGWAPFYSEDVRTWGPVSEWSPAQCRVLLEFLCPDCRLTEYGAPERVAELISDRVGGQIEDGLDAYFEKHPEALEHSAASAA